MRDNKYSLHRKKITSWLLPGLRLKRRFSHAAAKLDFFAPASSIYARMQLLRAARGSLASILMRRTALPLVCSSAFGILKPLARIAARCAARARLPTRRSVRHASPLAGPRAHGFIVFQGCGAGGLDVGGVGTGLHGDGDERRRRAGL